MSYAVHRTQWIMQQMKTSHDECECSQQTRRCLVSAALNWERRCMLQDCQNLSCGRAYSFVIGFDDLKKIFLSDFMAEHMFTPFSQVSNDTKPIKIARKESELLTSQRWNRTSGMTFEPINVADRNLIRQVWLCFLNFAFWLAVDHHERWKHVYVNMLHRPHIYASKLQSVHNRPTVVRYREHCAVFCHPFQCT